MWCFVDLLSLEHWVTTEGNFRYMNGTPLRVEAFPLHIQLLSFLFTLCSLISQRPGGLDERVRVGGPREKPDEPGVRWMRARLPAPLSGWMKSPSCVTGTQGPSLFVLLSSFLASPLTAFSLYLPDWLLECVLPAAVHLSSPLHVPGLACTL